MRSPSSSKLVLSYRVEIIEGSMSSVTPHAPQRVVTLEKYVRMV
jgi:hypothetical protein